jgi:hypothetical protein
MNGKSLDVLATKYAGRPPNALTTAQKSDRSR